MVDFVFAALAIITIVSAILALEAKEVVYGAVALALSFVGIAGFFALLDAVFLAMFQLTVYVGAIAVLILFTVMLVRREQWLKIKEGVYRTAGVVAAVIIALGLGYLVYASAFTHATPTLEQAPFTLLGPLILSDYWAALVALSLVLASAVIGAVVLAKLERD
ncbi:MAG: NADH-quinone oxidoreductase subunit J [Nitrososphaerales archaeon]